MCIEIMKIKYRLSDLGFILDRINIFQQYLHKKIPTMTKPKEL